MLLSLLKAARESIRLAKRKEHNILRSQSVKKLSLFDGEDPPSEILRDFRRKERSDSYPLRTAQSAPQRAYPRTSVSAVCGRMERRRDGKCIFAVFRRPDAKRRAEGARTVRSTPQPRNTGRGFAVTGAKAHVVKKRLKMRGLAALSNSLRDFFDKLRAHPLRSFPRLRYAARRSVLSVSAVPLIFACVQLFQAGEGGRKTSA